MNEIISKAEARMEKRIAHLSSDYASIRAGRANPSVLDKIMVDYYGSPTPINQLAAVSIVEARTLMIQPWDASVLRGIEKAIQTSELGINPQNDGKALRIVFPPLTEDRRREIVKDVHKMAEETKVSVRNVRREAVEKVKAKKKDGELTEDDLKKAEKKIQDITDKSVKEIDKLAAEKEKEVMSL